MSLSSFFKSFGHRPIDYEFLPSFQEVTHKPPAPLSRMLGWGVCLVLLLIFIWSYLGKLEIIANATGRLIVDGHSKVIKSLDTAKVASIDVKDGQLVVKGQRLLTLNSTIESAREKQLADQWLNSRFELARAKRLLSGEINQAFSIDYPVPDVMMTQQTMLLKSQWLEHQAQLKTLASELEQTKAQGTTLKAQINANHQRISLLEKRQKALKNLLDKGAYPQIDYDASENERLLLSGELATLKAQQAENNQAIATIEHRVTQYQRQWQREQQTTINTVSGQLLNLEQEWLSAKELSRLTTIHSPVDGIVQQLAIHTIGGVVTSAEQLMVIVPQSQTLQAQIKVLNQDIGFVQQGQLVKIKIDAFSYTKYGTIEGVITNISTDAVLDEQLGWVFEAQVTLNTLHIDAKGGAIALAAGMSLQADIKTDERRIIDYILSPIAQYQSEALRER